MARLVQAGVGPATEGERKAGNALAKLPRDWVVIANKVLPTPQGQSFEIDFIVLADHHIFTIDEKSWRGRIHGSDEVWVRDNGSSERSPLAKIDYVAKVLAGRLRDNVAYFKEIAGHPVVGRVLLSQIDHRPTVRDPRAADGILMLPSLVETLVQQDESNGEASITALRAKIEAWLHDLSDRPKTPSTIGPYRVIDVASGLAGSRVFQVEHTDGEKRVLTLYNMASADEVTRTFYRRESQTLRHLHGLGVAPEVQDTFSWSDDFLAVPSAVPAGQSLGALPPAQSEADALRDVRWAATACSALAKVHTAGVIHRALNPDAVYVSEQHGQPHVEFTRFFAARREAGTIAPTLDNLGLTDPYVAPEIAQLGSYGFASADSDTYSLGLVFLERLAAVPVDVLRESDGSVRVPEGGAGWPYLPESTVSELRDIFEAMVTPGSLAPKGTPESFRLSARDAADHLDALLLRIEQEREPISGKLLDRRYRVERLLGQGAFARTYLASDTVAPGLFALKQFLRPVGEEFQQARSEFDTLRQLRHKNLPTVYDVYPPSHEVHVKLEYVEGQPLSQAMGDYIGNLAQCRRLASDLLDAVDQLEQRALLHRDIKPENVILRDGTNEAVLIDFGIATATQLQNGVAGTPGYLPPETYQATEPPPTSDRYALGVLLFHALIGRSPFVDDDPYRQIPVQEIPGVPPDAQRFAHALLRAVAIAPDERFASAHAMRTALLGTTTDRKVVDITELPDLVNPWVDALRGLFRNSTLGNADNRGMDSDFARATYVSTALDDHLLPAIFRDHPRVVFLTGNPGDGKTAFLERVQSKLQGDGATCVSLDVSGWEWTFDGHTFRACYDASESHQGKSADEQLLARLDGLQGDTPDRTDLTVLVAINDGRLAAVVEIHGSRFGWMVRGVEQARHTPQDEAGGVWLVDLKQRAYVSSSPGPDGQSVMRRVLKTLVSPTQWDICTGCSAQQICPMRQNAIALGASGDGETSQRLEYLLLLAHLRAQRHVTMRDLRSGLAYLVTGDTGCQDVHHARHQDQALPSLDFWRSAFRTPTDRDVLLGELEILDPGRYGQPHLERFLYFRQEETDERERRGMFRDGGDVRPTAEPVAWLADVKRRLFFLSQTSDAAAGESLPQWRALLPYQHAAEFLEILSGQRSPDDVLPRIARGVGRSDGLSGAVISEGLCLRVAHSEVNSLTVLKLFPLEKFRLVVADPRASSVVEAIPGSLWLIHVDTSARLEITLDLYELLMRLASGLEPTSPELQPLLEDMAPFKSTVQLSNTRDLILVEGGRRLHLLTQRNGKIVREQYATGLARS